MKLSEKEVDELMGKFPGHWAEILPRYTEAPTENISADRGKVAPVRVNPHYIDNRKPKARSIYVVNWSVNPVTGQRTHDASDVYEVVLYPENASTGECGDLSKMYSREKVLRLFLEHDQFGEVFTLRPMSATDIAAHERKRFDEEFKKELEIREASYGGTMQKASAVMQEIFQPAPPKVDSYDDPSNPTEPAPRPTIPRRKKEVV